MSDNEIMSPQRTKVMDTVRISIPLVLILSLVFCSCDLLVMELEIKTDTPSKLKNCEGLKLDLIINQDSSKVRISQGIIEEGVLKFQLLSDGVINFDKDVDLTFIVMQDSYNKKCQYKKNSAYGVRSIKLKPVWGRRDLYEVELNRFIKIY